MLQANTTEFNRQIKTLRKVLPEMSIDILQKVTIDTYGQLQKATPEDTRRARGGWNAVVDGPPSEWKPAEGQSRYPLKSFNDNRKIKYNSVINISNNVEYIIPLDKGHSKTQAPLGIINPVLSRAIEYLSRLVAKANRRKIK